MDSDKDNSPDNENEDHNLNDDHQAPSDALSLTPDELEEEAKKSEASKPDSDVPPEETEKPASPIKRFFRRVNIYLLIFVLILVIAGVVTIVFYLNSQKVTPPPKIESQTLTEDALKQLANRDASVGNTSQTLTIQGNAVIEGQTLMRGNLNVAGNLQTGGRLQAPSLSISGETSLATAQINSLQVAQNIAVQGDVSLANLNVSGSSTFNGPMTASKITVTELILSGNATLQIPNHIRFAGPTPSRTIDSALGNGGSASVAGSDTSGSVSIRTGTGTIPGCFIHVQFHTAFTNNPHVIISPIGAAAGNTNYYVDRDKNSFSICTTNAAPINSNFGFDYFVTN